jgi:hypothetical protein
MMKTSKSDLLIGKTFHITLMVNAGRVLKYLKQIAHSLSFMLLRVI